jgi:arylsulfatase A-like enzyme
VLFIVTDDQRLEGTMAVMPKTTRWFHSGSASEGIEGGTFFPNAVTTTPWCCPARATIFTGRYAHNHGVQQNEESVDNPNTGGVVEPTTGGAALDLGSTLQRYLKDSGYRTGLFGKLFNESDLSVAPPYWDEWTFWGGGPYSGLEVGEGPPATRKFLWTYSTRYLEQRAEDFLQRANDQNDSQPWFLYVAPKAPHSAYVPEAKHADAPVPALDENDSAYFENDRSDKAPWVQTSHNDADEMKATWPQYLRTLKSVDKLVGGIMGRLKALNEDRDTIAVFTSDNGFLMGEHGLTGKGSPFLESIRVPFYMRWPNAPQWSGGGTPGLPGTDQRLVGNVDLAPTVVDAVNDGVTGDTDISPNPAMDGISLVDQSQPERDAILTEQWGQGGQPPPKTRGYCYGVDLTWASLVTRRFQYVEHYQTYPADPNQGSCPVEVTAQDDFGNNYRKIIDYVTDFDSVIFRDYYDITSGGDPGQLTNVLADDNVSPTGEKNQFFQLQNDANKENDPPVGSLAARLQELRECQGQSCRPQAGDPANVPVDVAITSAPVDPTDADDVKFTFTSTEPNSQFLCRKADDHLALPTAPWVPCTSPQTYSNMPAGRHGFSVQAISPSGSTDIQDHYWTQQDSAPPETTIVSRPQRSSASANATFTFTGSGTGNTFKCQLDNLPYVDCLSPVSYGVADGPHTFRVKAVDSSAEDPTPATFDWRVDTVAPNTQLSRSSTFSTNSSGATFGIAAEYLTGDRAVTGRIECRRDGGPFRPCNESKTYSRLAKGAHTVDARVRDVAGNFDPLPATDAWSIGALQVFDTAPDPTWPQIGHGTMVKAIVPDGAGGWYVGGDFTTVRDGSGTEHAHTDLVHIKSDKSVDNLWRPATNGTVSALVLHNGVLYAGGDFTQVSGTSGGTANTPRNRLAAIGAATGDPTAWNPNASGDVNALAIPPPAFTGAAVTSIYAGGAFQTVGGVTRQKAAEIQLAGTGAPTSWNPSVNSGATVHALAVHETSVFVGGASFTSVGGAPSPHPLVSRSNLAEIARTTGKPTAWAPNPDNAVLSLRIRRASSILPTIYVGGQFGTIGVPPVARSRAAEVNISDEGSVTSWNPSLTTTGSAAGSARDLLPLSCDVSPDPSCAAIVAGAFTSMNGAGGPVTRRRLAQADAVTGEAHDWNPVLNAPPLALRCSVDRCDSNPNRVLAAGGIFTTVGGAARNYLAFFDRPGP